MDTSIVTITSLVYTWPGNTFPTLDISDLRVKRGERLLLRGPSGSGKSTLLSAIAGVVDVPPQTVTVADCDIGSLHRAERDRYRGDHIGIIFQMFNLIPWISALENVLLPCRFSSRRRARAGADPIATASRLLRELGLGDPAQMSAPAMEMSIGQQQRIAAARALIGAPELILADEPTSALDEEAKSSFIDLLTKECTCAGATLVFVSHDRALESYFDRVLDLPDLNRVDQLC